MKSWHRSEGPAFGPTGSYEVPSAGPAGPVCPEWLKYGPIDRITGVLSEFLEPFGRRMSACSVASPASDGEEMNASVQSASGYATPAALAAAGNPATTATARTSTNRNRPNIRTTPRRERNQPPRQARGGPCLQLLTVDRSGAGGRTSRLLVNRTSPSAGRRV